MKNTVTAALISVFAAGAAWAADPIEGLWKTQPDDGVFYHVQMQQCGNAYCGVFKKKFENGKEVASPAIGKNAVFDMRPDGAGKYSGKAWKPSNGKTYKGKGKLNGNNLSMSGCVLGVLCIKQTWQRIK